MPSRRFPWYSFVYCETSAATQVAPVAASLRLTWSLLTSGPVRAIYIYIVGHWVEHACGSLRRRCREFQCVGCCETWMATPVCGASGSAVLGAQIGLPETCALTIQGVLAPPGTSPVALGPPCAATGFPPGPGAGLVPATSAPSGRGA